MDLVSQCALQVANVVWRPGHGGFAFTVVCKATFELRPELSSLAAVQEPVALADVYAEGGARLAVASDLVPAKKRPEVLLTGYAYAPEGRPASSVLARLVVGEIDKTIQVVGDRHFGRDGRLSDAETFVRMPLGWDRAPVGPDMFNPAGRSLGSSAQTDLLGRVPVPNLLLPGQRIRSRIDLVPTTGFGPISPWWPSRVAGLRRHAAGWDPGRWHEQPLAADIDLGYFNVAPSDQQRTLPFGEEAIYLENLHPRFAQLSTRLAPVAPVAMVDHGAGPQPLQLRCDTLIIDTDRGLAMLAWRAHVLLEHPDRPGRVVVTVPGALRASIPAWAANVSASDLEIEATIVPRAFVRSAPVLPFSDAPAQAAPAHFEAVSPSSDEGESSMTMGPGFVIPAAVLPFLAAQREIASRRAAQSAEHASALPFVRPSAGHEVQPEVEGDAATAVSSWDIPPVAVERWSAPAFEAAPVEVSETPAPPPMIGPIVIGSKEIARAGDNSEAAVPLEAAEPAEPEVAIDLDAYPPMRCGAIAAQLAHAGGDEGKVGEILRGQDLDAGRWERVHAHWLDRIREEAARSRKKLLSEYDGGYVGALERERGAIGLEEYARLAEAAERGKATAALSELELPEGGWAHIHRVWIGRMVKDVRLGKEVRAEIEARRGAG